jgi:DNA-binding response OmpR family regulator
MTKPNGVRKVFAKNSSRFLSTGPFSLDLHTRQASFQDKALVLPPCAFDYLVTLIRNAPHPVSYQDLVFQSQGYHLGRLEAQDLARCRVYLLRKVIEPAQEAPQFILAVSGFGYRLVL